MALKSKILKMWVSNSKDLGICRNFSGISLPNLNL